MLISFKRTEFVVVENLGDFKGRIVWWKSDM